MCKTVYDPFMGSGSALIAAHQTGREFYGMELTKRYTDVTIQRWVNFTGQTKIKKNGQEIEWGVAEG